MSKLAKSQPKGFLSHQARLLHLEVTLASIDNTLTQLSSIRGQLILELALLRAQPKSKFRRFWEIHK